MSGGVEEAFIEDNYKPTSWLTLIAGERQNPHFSGTVTEDAAPIHISASLFGYQSSTGSFEPSMATYYQPPPLTSISGPALSFAQNNSDSFIPLHGERDEEHQFGVQIPFHGWLLDADTFQTEAHNFLDHNNIGESSIFIPITIQGALIQASREVTLRSPTSLARYGQWAHLALLKSNRPADRRHHRRPALL